ncbi:MAG: XRE family transcriptional regulator [Pseudomonadota bacterium]
MTGKARANLARTATQEGLAAFGAEVRQLRKARQMTLAELADASGVSISHLSAIERGTVSASLKKITRIADALGVPEEWFFNHRPGSGPMERAYVVRQSNRRNLNLLYGESIEQSGYFDQLLSSSIGGQFYLGVSEYRPHSEQVLDQVFSREGEIHGVVLDGEMELTIDAEVITVRTGDSFSFPGRILHLLRNASDQPARMIWVNSPVIIPKFVALDTVEPMPQPNKKKSG